MGPFCITCLIQLLETSHDVSSFKSINNFNQVLTLVTNCRCQNKQVKLHSIIQCGTDPLLLRSFMDVIADGVYIYCSQPQTSLNIDFVGDSNTHCLGTFFLKISLGPWQHFVYPILIGRKIYNCIKPQLVIMRILVFS